ncbi:MAG: NTP transferase domain-containing protein [Verrucomicrobiales bacterium]|nr:NTP transferase domain-containing protein [Verrucomicrobiales bacterium]
MSEEVKITKAVILAAGRGTRMKGLTEDIPKPMIEVRGRPILETIIKGLVENGVKEILVVVGYRPEVITDYFAAGENFGCAISYVTQEIQDGTGRVVDLAIDFSAGDSFILSYGDILVAAESYADLVDFTAVDGKITVKVNEDVSKGGAVFIDEDGWLTGLIEKPGSGEPTSPYYNAGIYSFSARIFEYTAKLEKSPRGEYELTDAIAAMVEDGLKVKAVELSGDWADVRDPGVVESLNRE